jgi:hypothetical protein
MTNVIQNYVGLRGISLAYKLVIRDQRKEKTMKRFFSLLGEVILLVSLILFLNNCSGGNGGGSVGTSINAILISFPTGSVMPSNFQNAMVTVEDGQSRNNVTTAIVTMNTVTLSYNAAHQEYEGIVNVAPLENVTVSVTVGDKTFTASGDQFATYPYLNAPQSGDTWTSSNDYGIKWPVNAWSKYVVGVLDAVDPNGDLVWPADNALAVVDTMGAGDCAYSLPANSLSAGNRIALVGIVKAISIPYAAADSSFVIGGFSYASFTVN